jgi:small subunit ribosomal protein S9
MATTKKTTTKKTATHSTTAHVKDGAAVAVAKKVKPIAPKTKAVHAKAAQAKEPEHKSEAVDKAHSHKTAETKAPKHEGKYFYAVGRRKTAVANVRLFLGKSKHQVNKKELQQYFGIYAAEAIKPLQLTGLENEVYVYANIKGGGVHSQAQALAHAIAQAIIIGTPDFRKVLKKNGMLTRDSRRKERKKPGLKRARRGPQWAKR